MRGASRGWSGSIATTYCATTTASCREGWIGCCTRIGQPAGPPSGETVRIGIHNAFWGKTPSDILGRDIQDGTADIDEFLSRWDPTDAWRKHRLGLALEPREDMQMCAMGRRVLKLFGKDHGPRVLKLFGRDHFTTLNPPSQKETPITCENHSDKLRKIRDLRC